MTSPYEDPQPDGEEPIDDLMLREDEPEHQRSRTSA